MEKINETRMGFSSINKISKFLAKRKREKYILPISDMKDEMFL